MKLGGGACHHCHLKLVANKCLVVGGWFWAASISWLCSGPAQPPRGWNRHGSCWRGLSDPGPPTVRTHWPPALYSQCILGPAPWALTPTHLRSLSDPGPDGSGPLPASHAPCPLPISPQWVCMGSVCVRVCVREIERNVCPCALLLRGRFEQTDSMVFK